MAGLELDPWQQFVIHNALGERPDGKWAAFEVGVEVPRQNGKGGLLEARSSPACSCSASGC
jgi:phage terminase large subunit-like protein